MIRSAIKKICIALAYPVVLAKWKYDCKYLPLEKSHWKLYKIIHMQSVFDMNIPNLKNPKSFNEKVHWLMLFDQDINYVSVCDKLGLKEFVQKRIGEGYCPKTLLDFSGCGYRKELLENLPARFVVKTNHNSGGVAIIDKETMGDEEVNQKIIELNKQLHIPYGEKSGEWSYLFIKPRLFVEEYIGSSHKAAPADFKFHCSDGKVLWLQYIYDRGKNTKEIIVSPAGEEMGISFDNNMTHSTGFVKPENWDELLNIASKLSRGFKYVRVDLYSDSKSIMVGEITLYPLAARYKGVGHKVLGKLIKFDTSTFKPPVFCQRAI